MYSPGLLEKLYSECADALAKMKHHSNAKIIAVAENEKKDLAGLTTVLEELREYLAMAQFLETTAVDEKLIKVAGDRLQDLQKCLTDWRERSKKFKAYLQCGDIF